MANNPKWTHSLSHWKNNYAEWFQESSMETVMSYGTFFDCRPIYGDFSLLEELKSFMDEQLQYPLERFFFNMAQNTLHYDTQLTWLKNIKTFKVDQDKVFDIEKAMTPLVDAIRLYSLANRIFETNTGKRLKILTERKVFSQEESKELYQAYYYLMGLRLEKQAGAIINERKPPLNYIKINQLTQVQVVTIKEIFKIISDLQLKLKIQFIKSF
jgi:CBS domain-containing protein